MIDGKIEPHLEVIQDVSKVAIDLSYSVDRRSNLSVLDFEMILHILPAIIILDIIYQWLPAHYPISESYSMQIVSSFKH